MTTLRTLPSRIALVAATAAVTTLATSALPTAQADSNPTGTIHACVNNSTGQLRIVDGEPCKNNEHPLDWNIQGPRKTRSPRTHRPPRNSGAADGRRDRHPRR